MEPNANESRVYLTEPRPEVTGKGANHGREKVEEREGEREGDVGRSRQNGRIVNEKDKE